MSQPAQEQPHVQPPATAQPAVTAQPAPQPATAQPVAVSPTAAAPDSPLNLVALALSVGALVLAAMTLAAHLTFVIPIIVVCLTLSLLGAATRQAHALLGWIAAVLCAVALTISVLSAVSG